MPPQETKRGVSVDSDFSEGEDGPIKDSEITKYVNPVSSE